MQPIAWPRQFFSFGFFFFAYYGYIGIFTPYASLFFSEQGMTPGQVGVLMSLMQVMRIFGPNLWGWVADHSRQRVTVLRLTALCALISFCGMFVGQTFAHFLAIMIVLNLFTSAQGPLSEALMLAELRGDLTHYGRIRLWGSVGFIVAVMAGGKWLDDFGIGWLPFITLLVLGMVFGGSVWMREPPVAHAPRQQVSARGLIRRPEVIAFFASAFLMIAAHAALYVYYSLYLADIGYSKTVIGLMWSLGVIAEILFFYYQAPIFRRFGVQKLLFGSFLLAAVRFVLIGYGAESLFILLLAQILHAASFGVHHSGSVAMLQRWFGGPLQARGQALFISASYGLGGTLGGLIMSALWESVGPRAVFALAAAFALGGALAIALCYRWLTLREASYDTAH